MRRIPLYQKATWFIAATIGLFAYPALSLLVRAASHSLRDGLGIIAQIAGVLFGAVLFAIQVSLGQRSKAALLLTRSHRPYRDYLSEHTEVLLRGWRDYLQEAENGELERPTFPGTGGDPTQPSYREVLEDTAALLMHVFSGKAKSEVRRTLRHLDYSLRQTNAIGARAFRAGHDSQFFFTLIGRAFGVQGIGVYVEEIADALFDRMRTEGVEIAMRQLDASQRVLTGPTLCSVWARWC